MLERWTCLLSSRRKKTAWVGGGGGAAGIGGGFQGGLKGRDERKRVG